MALVEGVMVGVEVVLVFYVHNYIFRLDFYVQEDPSLSLDVEFEIRVGGMFGEEIDVKPNFAKPIQSGVNRKNAWHPKNGRLLGFVRLLLNYEVGENA